LRLPTIPFGSAHVPGQISKEGGAVLKEEIIRKRVRIKATLCACLLALSLCAGIFSAMINISVAAESTTIRAGAAVII